MPARPRRRDTTDAALRDVDVIEGWVNLTDLVPLEGDDDAPALPRARPAATGGGDDDSSEESSDDEVMDFSGAAAWAASAAARTEHGDDCPYDAVAGVAGS